MSDTIVLEIKNWKKYQVRASGYAQPWWFSLDNKTMFDSTIYKLSDSEFRAWIFLLCEASRQNKGGVVEVSYDWAVRACNVKKSAVQNLIQKNLVNTPMSGSVQIPSGSGQHNTIQNNTNNSTDEHWLHEVTSGPQDKPAEIFNFETLYKNFPRKEGKTRGIKICKTQIKTQDDFNRLETAVKNYSEYVKNNVTEVRFIKHFSTFMNEWRDWVDSSSSEKLKVKSKKTLSGFADV